MVGRGGGGRQGGVTLIAILCGFEPVVPGRSVPRTTPLGRVSCVRRRILGSLRVPAVLISLAALVS